jgi:hypothetical protein
MVQRHRSVFRSVKVSFFLGRLGNVSPGPDGGYPGGNTASARGRQRNFKPLHRETFRVRLGESQLAERVG